ncbi:MULTISPECIES: hypothetical protein [Mycobacterium]|uniref:Uncharacterized protein n=1 Tax=Mycobacterium paragordonae TaxID=1389713 RepID=A0ABQ1CG06_9MYCO|nr:MULTISPECIES: hypothetical protein [Mycobacterium]QNI09727.1 hypothetical protein GAN17_25345 [Mycobacterium kubicae]QNI15262.1 hypothetical protein GAN18_29215 [Mycobacterium kubicae]GFG83161.1 hypothetical protein MPRG_64370 [Mycobacterium paragordonae]
MSRHREVVVRQEESPDDRRGGRVVVEFAGWTVHIAGALVTVAPQDLSGKSIQDLRFCLEAAYDVAGIRVDAVAPQWSPHISEAVISALLGGRREAHRHWRRRSYGIYQCISAAWGQSGMDVPYTLLIRALRAALPPGTTLTGFNDDATDCAQVVALFSHAVSIVASRRFGGSAAGSVVSGPGRGGASLSRGVGAGNPTRSADPTGVAS